MERQEFLTYYIRFIFEGDKTITRTIKISGDNTLDDLSDILLDSLNFDHDHLYAFSLDNDIFGPNSYHIHPDPDQDSTSISIKETGFILDQEIKYFYDFGVEWEFTLFIDKIEPTDTKIKGEVIESIGKLEQYEE